MSNPLYYPNRDMLASGFPTNWTLLKRLMWVRIMQGGSIPPAYETVTGNPVSFETVRPYKLRQLSAAFAPVQDLHGYDAPWPAGGGANKWDEEWEVGAYGANGTPSAVTDRIRCKNYISVTGGATYRYVSSHGTYWFVDFFDADKNPLQTTVAMKQINTNITAPADAAFMLFYTDAGYGTTYLNDIAINYPSSVTTYSPYSNICPISGWDSVTVNRTGKNLLPHPTIIHNARLMLCGADEKSTPNNWMFLKAGTYRVSGEYGETLSGTPLGYIRYGYDKTLHQIAGSPHVYTTTNFSFTITLTQDTEIELFLYTGLVSTYDLTKLTVQMELGSSSPSDYVPYNGRSIIIQLGNTYYGAQLDVLNGKMTVTWAERILNGSETWAGTPNGGWYTQENSLKKLTSYVGHILADTLPAGLVGENRLYGYPDENNRYPDQNWIYYRNSNLTSPAQVKAFFAANPTQVVYELATPFEIPLTPVQIATLHGTNNVWSDANGDVTVEYRSN